MLEVRRNKIKEINDDDRNIRFDTSWLGKITGSRFQAVLGDDPYTTEFAAACFISRICSDYETTKYTEAGEIIEPIIRKHVRDMGNGLGDIMGLSPTDRMDVEEPVPKEICKYDHFKKDPVFGGMVDGDVKVNGRRHSVLEIKTASDRSKWTDENGDITKVPENYMLQASLYAELSGLDSIVFAVGFLEEKDYDDPASWRPEGDNFHIVYVKKKDISQEMEKGTEWFQRYILKGVTPNWSEKDKDMVDRIQTICPPMLPAGIESMIKEYSETRDPELRKVICDALGKRITKGYRSIEYRQNKMLFRVTLADDGGYVMTAEEE